MPEDLLFNDIGVDRIKPFKKGDWKEIALHDEGNVRGFFGDYRWLSNFHLCPVEFECQIYPSSESAYQAAKVKPSDRIKFQTCTPERSKSLWKDFPSSYTAEKWDIAKYDIMATIVFSKFYINLDLRQKLVSTHSKFLREDNWWRDIYWGYDVNMKAGENMLGKILMRTRSFWR